MTGRGAPPALPRVLAIAGSDSGGGAGIQADIKTITMLGGHALTAVTAITAQNTVGVSAILPVPAEMVVAQVDAVAGDIGVDAIKIGMIGSAETAEALADRLRRPDLATVPVVFDPVMVASTGAILADPATALAFARLLSRAAVSTPNLDELAALTGQAVDGEEAIAEAAAHLIEDRGAGAILATGVRGRDAAGETLSDLLFELRDEEWRETRWSDTRIDTDQDHGTGCTLSSAIACGLAAGRLLPDAIGFARLYVRAALAAAPGLGRGHGPMGHGLGRAHFGA